MKETKTHRFYEGHKRSIVKTITYRILIIISTAVTVFLTTHNWKLTLSITGLSNVINTFLYYFHERAWNQVHWGKHHKK